MTMIWSICMDMIIVIRMGQKNIITVIRMGQKNIITVIRIWQKNIITSMSIAMRQLQRMWQHMDMIMEMR